MEAIRPLQWGTGTSQWRRRRPPRPVFWGVPTSLGEHCVVMRTARWRYRRTVRVDSVPWTRPLGSRRRRLDQRWTAGRVHFCRDDVGRISRRSLRSRTRSSPWVDRISLPDQRIAP